MKIVTRSLFLLFLLIPVGLSGQTEWQLVWSDEFNADGLPDTAVWSYDNGFARNEEAQWYQEGNAYCKDGLLKREKRKGVEIPGMRPEVTIGGRSGSLSSTLPRASQRPVKKNFFMADSRFAPRFL